MKPKVGDIVTLKPLIKVGGSNDDFVWLSTNPEGTGIAVPVRWIASIEPRPLKVGDRIAWPSAWQGTLDSMTVTETKNGRVLAIDGNAVWALADNGFHHTVPISRLTRIGDA